MSKDNREVPMKGDRALVLWDEFKPVIGTIVSVLSDPFVTDREMLDDQGRLCRVTEAINQVASDLLAEKGKTLPGFDGNSFIETNRLLRIPPDDESVHLFEADYDEMANLALKGKKKVKP